MQTFERLLCRYRTTRETSGDLVLMMPWPTRPLLGCAVPTAILWIGGWFVFGSDLGKYGFPMIATLFAVIVIPIIIYQSSHAWVMRRGLIKSATTLMGRVWPASEWSPAQAVVLKRELWPYGRGSTDRVFVETSGGFRLGVLGIYNWDGKESRLASGGRGSLARSGPIVPNAPEPPANTADANLKPATSQAIQEVADLLALELEVPVAFECEYVRTPPDDTS